MASGIRTVPWEVGLEAGAVDRLCVSLGGEKWRDWAAGTSHLPHSSWQAPTCILAFRHLSPLIWYPLPLLSWLGMSLSRLYPVPSA